MAALSLPEGRGVGRIGPLAIGEVDELVFPRADLSRRDAQGLGRLPQGRALGRQLELEAFDPSAGTDERDMLPGRRPAGGEGRSAGEGEHQAQLGDHRTSPVTIGEPPCQPWTPASQKPSPASMSICR